MKPQSEQNDGLWHHNGLLNERVLNHINYIKHKVALLEKMFLLRPAFSDTINAGFRSLKVNQFYSPRNYGHGYRQVPQILLQGMWLRKIGFEIDDYARVVTLPKLIIISCANPDLLEIANPAPTPGLSIPAGCLSDKLIQLRLNKINQN
jgi:hypothetical protein